MLRDRKKTASGLLMLCAWVVFLIAVLGMICKKEPFYTWFYSFAWWAYILFVESFLSFRGHRSLLFTNPARFLLLLPLSVMIWLIFEVFNFRLQNWHYLNLPPQRGPRWIGYTIAYATVLPAIFSTVNLLDIQGVVRQVRAVPFRIDFLKKWSVRLGIATLVLPVLFPKVFFPLVWLGFIFCFDPYNYKYGAGSILRDLEKGAIRTLSLLLIGGLICGMLWEFWNFWAGSKWSYTIPYLGFLKIFEMPILGFLGFPFFAVECYVMTNTFFLFVQRLHQEENRKKEWNAWVLMAAVAVVFSVVSYIGIDAFTVASLQTVKH